MIKYLINIRLVRDKKQKKKGYNSVDLNSNQKDQQLSFQQEVTNFIQQFKSGQFQIQDRLSHSQKKIIASRNIHPEHILLNNSRNYRLLPYIIKVRQTPMKSVKYSTTSKIKKQHQQQKERASQSILNTLKQDDQITSNLLDTLNQDYLHYLEELMGKQSSHQQFVNNQAALSHSRNPSINQRISEDNIEIERLKVESNSYLQLIPQKDQSVSLNSLNSLDLESSIVKCQSKHQSKPNSVKNSVKQAPEQEQTNNLAQIFPVSRETKGQTKKPVKNATLQTRNQPKHKKQQHSKDKNKLIHNIEGYLQSLTTIKPQRQHVPKSQQMEKRRKSKSVSLNTNQHIVPDSKEEKRENKQKAHHTSQRKKQQHFDDRKEQNKQIYINPFGKDLESNNQQFSKYLAKKSQRQKPIIQFSKYFDDSSDNSDSIGNSNCNKTSSSEKDGSPDGFSHQELILGPFNRKEKSKLKNRQQNLAKPNQFDSKDIKKNDTSLQQLLIKIITKYNRLLSKYNQEKHKNQLLAAQCSKLKVTSQTKDIQIQTLKQLHKQLFQNPDQIFLASKTQSLRPKANLQFEKYHKEDKASQKYQNKNMIDLEKKQNFDSYKFDVRNLDFITKPKQQTGKTVNMQKMMNFDHNHKEKSLKEQNNNKKQRNPVDPSQRVQQKGTNYKKSMSGKQKRSISWRQNLKKQPQQQQIHNYLYAKNSTSNKRQKNEHNFNKKLQNERGNNFYQFSATLPNQSGQIKNKKILYEGVYTHQQKNRNEHNDMISQAGQYSARKRDHPSEQEKKRNFFYNERNTFQNNGKHPEAQSLVRDRSYSQSYNSLSFKRKSINDLKYKFMKDNSAQQSQEPAKYWWKDKLNQRQNQSSSESSNDQHIKQNLQYFAKSIRDSNSDHHFKKDVPFYHEQSESTDSELLQKLLSIQKNSNSLGLKKPGNKTFFK